jgi:hypothetical protein
MMRPASEAQLRAARKTADKYISRNGEEMPVRATADAVRPYLERALRVVKAHLPTSVAKKYVHAEFQIIVDALGFHL